MKITFTHHLHHPKTRDLPAIVIDGSRRAIAVGFQASDIGGDANLLAPARFTVSDRYMKGAFKVTRYPGEDWTCHAGKMLAYGADMFDTFGICLKWMTRLFGGEKKSLWFKQLSEAQ